MELTVGAAPKIIRIVTATPDIVRLNSHQCQFLAQKFDTSRSVLEALPADQHNFSDTTTFMETSPMDNWILAVQKKGEALVGSCADRRNARWNDLYRTDKICEANEIQEEIRKVTLESMPMSFAHLGDLADLAQDPSIRKIGVFGYDYAVKVPMPEKIHWSQMESKKEIASLVKLRHLHITQLIECAQNDDKTYVLQCEKTDSALRMLIDSRKRQKVLPTVLQDGRPFSRHDFSTAHSMQSIASGMLHLHGMKSVHTDLPTHHPYKADIYSFGMVCYEILTGRYPFDGVEGAKELQEKVTAGARPKLPENMSGNLKRLITLCWHTVPLPCMKEKNLCTEERRKFLKQLCDEGKREYGDVKNEIINGECEIEEILVDYVLLGLIQSHGAHEHRRQADHHKVNVVDTKLKGELAAAQAMDDEAQPSKAFIPGKLFDFSFPKTVKFQIEVVTESVCGVKSSELNDGEPPRKTIRSRNWSADEIRAMLETTKEAPRLDAGPDWDYVSENLSKKYGFDRASTSCENLWGSLLLSYRAIPDPEYWKIHNAMTNCVSSWEMDEDKLPQAFDFQEWFERMDRILNVKSFEEETKTTYCDEELSCDELDSETEEIDTQSEDESLSGESAVPIESQAEVTADSHVPQTEPSQELCCETNSRYSGRKRSAAAFDEDDLIARIIPFVNKQIDDALTPLISAFRSREEDEQKHRKKMLALEEEKLALMRQEMQLAHSNASRVGHPQIHTQPEFGKGFVPFLQEKSKEKNVEELEATKSRALAMTRVMRMS